MHNLHSIVIDDTPPRMRSWKEITYNGKTVEFFNPDERIIEFLLAGHQLGGSWPRWSTTAPPTEMIRELFQAFSESSIRPSSFTIRINLSNNLRGLELTDTQRHAVQRVLVQAHSLECKLRYSERWGGSQVRENSGAREEMAALTSLAATFFAIPSLTSLELVFDEHGSGQNKKVSLSALLPPSGSWPHLRSLSLKYLPLSLDDLQALVAALRNTLKKLYGHCLTLQSGSWLDALDLLRGFEALRHIDLGFLRGGEFGEGQYNFINLPRQAMASYVMKEIDRNPLLNFKLEIKQR
jgi:hypothetical protein